MRIARLALAALAFTALGCADGPFDPEVADIVGNYEAAAFYIVEGGDSLDFLDAGVEISLTLAEDHTTSGRFFAPGGGIGGGDLEQSLVGTWEFSGRTIVLDHPLQTVLQGQTLTVPRAGVLEIRESVQGARYVLSLERIE